MLGDYFFPSLDNQHARLEPLRFTMPVEILALLRLQRVK